MADNNKIKENAKNSKKKKSFFKDVKAELKKVTWPTKKQLINGTIGVIVIVIITSIIVFILDFTFSNFNEHVVKNLKEAISSGQNIIDETNTTIQNQITNNMD